MKSMLSALLAAGLILGMAAPAAASDGYLERLLRLIRVKIQQAIEYNEIDLEPRPVSAVPEPSSALVFGGGLLIASQIARRRRRR